MTEDLGASDDRALVARFWAKVSRGDDGSCWPWRGSLRKGYGAFWIGGKNVAAHRASLILSGREIPEGLVVDHICRNRACVNPSHLRIVTNRTNLIENSIAAAAISVRKTHCKRGHPLEGYNVRFNTSGTRRCRQCSVDWNRANRQRHRQDTVIATKAAEEK